MNRLCANAYGMSHSFLRHSDIWVCYFSSYSAKCFFLLLLLRALDNTLGNYQSPTNQPYTYT